LVNGLEIKTDEEIATLIAMRQPLARDLRFVIALSKTVTDLERIGDEAKGIARMVVHIYDSDTSPPNNRLFRDVVTMARLASKMLHDALDALARLEVQQAMEIKQNDQELDQEFQAGLRRLVTYMMEDSRTVGHAINVIFMLRSLERIGDHAKNIAEYVIYLVKGKDVRHPDKNNLENDVL
jgi:phosphate transport system protein